ncbi:hypothetical protein [Methylorubrum salsuginis]|uniref:hypothetical protein n=1 Tax=Methylorubrum salsuginis TaxID=414703 RepID=UPI0010420A8E|nr:hypothetical protein [Methylorubrum salsuginis]
MDFSDLPSFINVMCHPGFNLVLFAVSTLILAFALTGSAIRQMESRIPNLDRYSAGKLLALLSQSGHRVACASEDRPIFDEIRREGTIRMAVMFLLLGFFFMGFLPRATGCLPAPTTTKERGGSGLMPALPGPQTGR